MMVVRGFSDCDYRLAEKVLRKCVRVFFQGVTFSTYLNIPVPPFVLKQILRLRSGRRQKFKAIFDAEYFLFRASRGQKSPFRTSLPRALSVVPQARRR
jgi:hypothetical protein